MCANQIIKYVSVPGEHLGCHPDKLCLVLKQCLRETAVGKTICYYNIHKNYI